MLTKIAFTIAVVVGVLALFRWRRQRQLVAIPARNASAAPVTANRRPWLKWLAVTVLVLSVGGAGLWLLNAWRAAGEIVTVQVFDAGTGAMTEYRAYRSDLDGRSFRTVDGRRITLAETERMETLGVD